MPGPHCRIARAAAFLCAWASILSSLTGCQCCRLTERYQDGVDYIADHEHSSEWMYHSTWDLTRIGRPDWCCSRVNNFLCPCRCNQAPPVACPTYIHLGYGWENRAQKMTKPEKSDPSDAAVPDGQNMPEPQLPTQPEIYSPPPVNTNPAPAPQPVPDPAPATSSTDWSGGKAFSNSDKNNKRPTYVTPAGSKSTG